MNKILLYAGIMLLLIPPVSFAQDQPVEEQALQEQEPPPAPKQKPVLFTGEITDDNINIRTDSTVSSEVICAVNEGETLEVIKESYDWYKIRLPKSAPAYISRGLAEPIDDKTAKVRKNNVNIRLGPDLSSPILGQADKNEVINVVEEGVGWYKIEPTSGTSGWVHKRFVAKVDPAMKKEKQAAAEKAAKDAPDEDNIAVEGIIKPYGRVFRRTATHKLITPDKSIFLLKGNKDSLQSLNNHRVKVTGRLNREENRRYPLIEIEKIEALD